MVNRIGETGPLWSIALLLVSAGAGWPGADSVAAGTDWPSFLGGSARGAYRPQERLSPPLKLLWVFTSDGTIESSPAVVEGVVYIGSCDGYLYALDARIGRLKWKFKAGGAIVSSPTVDAEAGVVYFGCNDFKLYGVSARDGKLLWQYATAPSSYARTHGDQVKASPALKDGTIFIGNYKGKWLAIKPEKIDSGTKARQVKSEPIWMANGTLTFASPATDGRSVVFASLDRIACLDSGTGKLRWERKGLGSFLASPVIDDQTVYAATAGNVEWQSRRFTNGSVPNAERFARTPGSVLALNLATGQTRWQSSTRDRVIASPAVTNDQVIVATVQGQVAGLDRTSGGRLWETSATTTEDGIWASPAATGNFVAVTSTDGWLYLFDRQSHKLAWAFDTRSPIYASPAIANGTIFIANTSGYVMAFGQGTAISHELAPREPRDLDWAVSFPVQNSFWSLVGTVESFKSQPMETWLKVGPRSRYRKDRGVLLDFLFTLEVERGAGERYDLGTGKPVKINTGDVVSVCSRPPTTYNQLHLSPTQVGPSAEMENRRRVRLVCALENPLNPLAPKGERPFSAYLIQVQPPNDETTPPQHWPVWHYNNWIHFTTEIEEKGHAQALGGLGLEFVGWGTCDERVHARYFPGSWWQRMKLHTYTQRSLDFYKIAMNPKTRRWWALPLHTPGMQAGMQAGIPPNESARYNKRPTCEIIADRTTGKAPLTVQFSANATDQDGRILWTTWDFDAADGISIDSADRSPSFTFRKPGRSIVSLTAMDNGLMPAFAHAVITVEP